GKPTGATSRRCTPCLRTSSRTIGRTSVDTNAHRHLNTRSASVRSESDLGRHRYQPVHGFTDQDPPCDRRPFACVDGADRRLPQGGPRPALSGPPLLEPVCVLESQRQPPPPRPALQAAHSGTPRPGVASDPGSRLAMVFLLPPPNPPPQGGRPFLAPSPLVGEG